MTLIDFTLSNARQFYLSMGNPLAVKGLISIVGMKCILFLWQKSASSQPPISRQHYYFLMLLKLCETTELR